MTDPARTSRSTSRNWVLALVPLLLVAVLVIPALGDIALNGDETFSLMAAGVFRPGPHSFTDVWNYTTRVSPDQALGWPLLLSVWGRLAGWSEMAARALPLFGGLLALAWVYRAGNDLFTAQVGFFAALLLSASMFPQTNMLHARSFPMVMFFTTWSLWAYWRNALQPRPPGRRAQASLLAGVTGLLYWQYFGALLLPVLGLFHLLFVPKNRRWWRTLFLLGLATLASLPQLPSLLNGIALAGARSQVHSIALTPPQLLAQFLRYLANGVVSPAPWVGELLVILLPLALLFATLRQLRTRRPAGDGWLLTFVSVTLVLLIIAANEALRIVSERRIRYLIALWPLLALLAGVGLHQLARAQRRLVAALLALWLILGVFLALTTDLRYELGYFSQSSIHRIMPVMREQISPSDFLIQDYHVAALDTRRHYARLLDVDWATMGRFQTDPYKTIRPLHAEYPYVWLLYLTKDRVGFADLPQALGRVFCERTLDEWGLTLERYALYSVENCPDRPVRLVFERDIRLTAPEITLGDGRLRLDAHFRSVDEILLARYSLAVHVIDPRTGQRLAQGDTGVGPGAIVPLRSEIDVRALPPGEYELRVGLYDWQSGEQLQARDLVTDEVGDMHTLQRFRIG